MNFFKNIFKPKKTETAIENKSFEEIYADLGMFEYNEKGLKFTSNDCEKLINWSDIEQINAYKKDVYVYDLVVMEIVIGENILTINEETPGWFQLIIKLKEIFRDIPEDWEIKITQPAFARNFTTIYIKT